VADLEKIKDIQERIQVDLMKLQRTYSILKRDERFLKVEQQLAASLANCHKILAEYNEINAATEQQKEERGK
jgi:hypothetical protein